MEFTYHICPDAGRLHLVDQDILFNFEHGHAMVDTIHPTYGEITTYDGLMEDGDGQAEEVLSKVKEWFNTPLYREGNDYYVEQRIREQRERLR